MHLLYEYKWDVYLNITNVIYYFIETYALN